jgi:hypothetical protein
MNPSGLYAIAWVNEKVFAILLMIIVISILIAILIKKYGGNEDGERIEEFEANSD